MPPRKKPPAAAPTPKAPKLPSWWEDCPVQQEEDLDVGQRPSLAPGPALQACSGADIYYQKSSAKRSKYLAILPGLLSLGQQASKEAVADANASAPVAADAPTIDAHGDSTPTMLTQETVDTLSSSVAVPLTQESHPVETSGVTEAPRSSTPLEKTSVADAPQRKLGQMSNLHGAAPVLTLPLGAGRALQLRGHRVATSSKFILLTLQPKKGKVICKEVFSGATVFGDAQEIMMPLQDGVAERHALPQDESEKKTASPLDHYGGSSRAWDGSMQGKVSDARIVLPALTVVSSASTPKSISARKAPPPPPEEPEESDDDSEAFCLASSPVVAPRQAPRRQSVKRVQYRELAAVDNSSSESDDNDSKASATRPQKKARAKMDVLLLSSSDDNDSVTALDKGKQTSAKKKTTTKAAAPKRVTSKHKKSDLEEDTPESDGLGGKMTNKRAGAKRTIQKAPKQAASKKKKKADSSDSDEVMVIPKSFRKSTDDDDFEMKISGATGAKRAPSRRLSSRKVPVARKKIEDLESDDSDEDVGKEDGGDEGDGDTASSDERPHTQARRTMPTDNIGMAGTPPRRRKRGPAPTKKVASPMKLSDSDGSIEVINVKPEGRKLSVSATKRRRQSKSPSDESEASFQPTRKKAATLPADDDSDDSFQAARKKSTSKSTKAMQVDDGVDSSDLYQPTRKRATPSSSKGKTTGDEESDDSFLHSTEKSVGLATKTDTAEDTDDYFQSAEKKAPKSLASNKKANPKKNSVTPSRKMSPKVTNEGENTDRINVDSAEDSLEEGNLKAALAKGISRYVQMDGSLWNAKACKSIAAYDSYWIFILTQPSGCSRSRHSRGKARAASVRKKRNSAEAPTVPASANKVSSADTPSAKDRVQGTPSSRRRRGIGKSLKSPTKVEARNLADDDAFTFL